MKIVAAAVVIEDGLVLLTRRAPGEQLAGLWEFPGGKLEPNETVQQCIVRELQEELGVASDAQSVIAENIHHYPGGVIQLLAVAVTLRTKKFVLTVHDHYAWAPFSRLLDYELAPADVPIAHELVRMYG